MDRATYIDQLIASAGGGNWKPYAYAFDPVTLNTTDKVTQPASISFTDNKPFIWDEGLYSTDVTAVQAGTDLTHGGVLIKLDEVSGLGQGGQGFFSIEAMFGRAGITGGAKKLARPLLIGGTGKFMLELQNLVAATIVVRLTLIGLKRY